MDPKINAALELLNAAAKEKKEDLKGEISEKYAHLKDTLWTPSKDFVKENPWWVGGAALLLLTAAGLCLYFYTRRND